MENMKTQIGSLVTGDLKDGTMTFEIQGEMIMRAGVYAIVEKQTYDDLLEAVIEITSITEKSLPFEEKVELMIKANGKALKAIEKATS